ncbi:unnamed protein product [Anisakis simplex]|uniref:Carboxypeptidase n=1 Tax=Anisakis simplex TaxID=6269 RepID=A0A3P6NQ66_ANISI|nr:unnamed protein product [Anisakis simplex]
MKLDVVSVKGGSHYVALNRPAPALQLVSAFLKEQPYNTSAKVDTELKLPKFQYWPPLPPVKRTEADRVYSLPGLTYTPNFKQYSGYLKSKKGNYLHYWYMESQGDPRNDPIVIWLNGGPGCSSLMGLLEELGPFRPNPDGRTLFENVFSWNKAANLMFLETPRGVGFSYQNMTENPDTEWDDTKTAEETADAIEDFFNIYKHLRSHRNELYLTGESYAGIYIPMTTNVLIDRIQVWGVVLGDF